MNSLERLAAVSSTGYYVVWKNYFLLLILIFVPDAYVDLIK